MNKEELQKQIESIIRDEVVVSAYAFGCWADDCYPEAEYEMYDIDLAAAKIVDFIGTL